MVIKYAVPGYPFPTLWLGITNLIGNTLIMLRCVFSPSSLPSTP